MRMLAIGLLISGLPFSVCSQPPDGTACTTLFAYGVNATVTNEATGVPVSNATLTLTEGTYSEVMQAFPTGPGEYVGAGERAGTYTLTATAPGFQTKTIENIVVTADECHVRGVRVNVRLQPEGGTGCTDIFVYGVTATVTNATTGALITNAALTLTEGSYIEQMQMTSAGGYSGAGERAGTYTLNASAPGFQTQTVQNIVVTADECHVRGVHLDVKLQPAS